MTEPDVLLRLPRRADVSQAADFSGQRNMPDAGRKTPLTASGMAGLTYSCIYSCIYDSIYITSPNTT